ncbi:MAG TPA: metalloregulator ArsR/SmtB family transcription factor [Reyranella sp.]|jgi:DNA-binding transcriptional ArsR family regulator|nr:metalloregulator ArsR/SmtB family transcription factor [Reyranella sp.]
MSKAKQPLLSDDDASALADLFRLLGDPSRLRIVVSCLRTPLAVSDIAERLGLSVSLVSHHLRLLKGARLVRADRQGKQVYYVADDAHVRRMVEGMVTHIGEH